MLNFDDWPQLIDDRIWESPALIDKLLSPLILALEVNKWFPGMRMRVILKSHTDILDITATTSEIVRHM